MGEIAISGHHLGMLEEAVNEEPSGVGYSAMCLVYGKEFVDSIYRWGKTLSRDTDIKIIDNMNFARYIPDAICEINCPYLNDCRKNPAITLGKMAKRLSKHPLYLGSLILHAVFSNSDREEIEKRQIKAGERYKLHQLIAKTEGL